MANIHAQHKDKQFFRKAQSLWSGLWGPFPHLATAHLLWRGHGSQALRGHQRRSQLTQAWDCTALTPLKTPQQ